MATKQAISTTKKLEKSKYDYDLEELTDFNKVISSGDYTVRLTQYTKTKTYNLNFNLSLSEDENCCGLKSVGGFYITNSTTIPLTEKIKFIKSALELLVKQSRAGKREQTLFFTLVESPVCNIIAEAVKDQKLFTLVKTFTNVHSGNKNYLYVSN